MITIKNFFCMIFVIFVTCGAPVLEAGNNSFKAQTITESAREANKNNNRNSKSLLMLFGGMFLGPHAGRLILFESYREQQEIQESSEQKLRELSQSQGKL